MVYEFIFTVREDTVCVVGVVKTSACFSVCGVEVSLVVDICTRHMYFKNAQVAYCTLSVAKQ